MRIATSASASEKRERSASARMMAKERSIDGVAVADVVVSCHRHPCSNAAASRALSDCESAAVPFLARMASTCMAATGNRARQFPCRRVGEGCCLGCPSDDKSRAVFVADNGDVGCRLPRAAFFAAGNVNGKAALLAEHSQRAAPRPRAPGSFQTRRPASRGRRRCCGADRTVT